MRLKLQDCLYCDGVAVVVPLETGLYQVHCAKCAARGPRKTTGDAAVDAWNEALTAMQERHTLRRGMA